MKWCAFFLIFCCLNLNVSAASLIVAHRGASKDAPENTIPAFELAWKQGADAIEADFHLTSDGEIVCFHDKDTQKITGEKRVIKKSTLEDLRKLDVGKWRGKAWIGTQIPTIEEVLKIVPEGKKIFIEIKCGPEILPKLYEELKASKLKKEQMVIISFNPRVIHKVKLDAPEIKAMWLCSLKAKGGKLDPSAQAASNLCKLIAADGFSTSAHHLVDKEYVQKLNSQGLEYHAWTIDDLAQVKRFAQMGVSSITTNRPGYLKKHLSEPVRQPVTHE